mgnify:CR=1 FL=1
MKNRIFWENNLMTYFNYYLGGHYPILLPLPLTYHCIICVIIWASILLNSFVDKLDLEIKTLESHVLIL